MRDRRKDSGGKEEGRKLRTSVEGEQEMKVSQARKSKREGRKKGKRGNVEEKGGRKEKREGIIRGEEEGRKERRKVKRRGKEHTQLQVQGKTQVF